MRELSTAQAVELVRSKDALPSSPTKGTLVMLRQALLRVQRRRDELAVDGEPVLWIERLLGPTARGKGVKILEDALQIHTRTMRLSKRCRNLIFAESYDVDQVWSDTLSLEFLSEEAEYWASKRRPALEEAKLLIKSLSFPHVCAESLDQHVRYRCIRCGRSAFLMCAQCSLWVSPQIRDHFESNPLSLPFEVVTVCSEEDWKLEKCTTSHAYAMASGFCTRVLFPEDSEHVLDALDPSQCVLLYPGDDALSPSDVFSPGSSVSKVIIIDSSWNASKKIFKDERIRRFSRVQVAGYTCVFWRWSNLEPCCLSSIESLFYLSKEVSVMKGWGEDSIRSLDCLLFPFYAQMCLVEGSLSSRFDLPLSWKQGEL